MHVTRKQQESWICAREMQELRRKLWGQSSKVDQCCSFFILPRIALAKIQLFDLLISRNISRPTVSGHE